MFHWEYWCFHLGIGKVPILLVSTIQIPIFQLYYGWQKQETPSMTTPVFMMWVTSSFCIIHILFYFYFSNRLIFLPFIQGAAYINAWFLHNMSIDHSCFDIFMAK